MPLSQAWPRGLVLLCTWAVACGVQQLAGRRRGDCVTPAQKPETFRSEWKNAAFVVGGMGKYGNVPGIHKCMALAESLSRIGGWQGNVYIITDSNLDSATLAKLHEGNPNAHVRVIDPIRDGVDFRQHNAGGGGGYLKTLMFDLPDIPEDILIWHDCDKLIAQPDCISEMFEAASLDFGPDVPLRVGALPHREQACPTCPRKPVCTNTSWGRAEGRCGDGVHVGVFAAHRQWSKKIIEAWKQHQQMEPEVFDRYTLWDALVELDLLANVSELPPAFFDHMWNKGDVGCINHISGPRAWDEKNAGALTPLLESMCLKSCSSKELIEVYGNCLKWKDGEVVLDPRLPEATQGLISMGVGCS